MCATTNGIRYKWQGMHKRVKYKRGNYGKFEVSVCPEWSGETGFENFKQWAMSNGFRPDLVIDRIDTRGSYSPDNCRWITKKENCRNRVDTVFIEDGTERVPLPEYCEKHKCNYKRTYNRIYQQQRRKKQRLIAEALDLCMKLTDDELLRVLSPFSEKYGWQLKEAE